MKNHYGRILAVLMAVAMVLSMFTFTVFATGDDAVVDTEIVATLDEATADEATADETTEDEATADEATEDEPAVDTTVDEATGDETTGDEATADELGILGDVDLSGIVNIKDATLIQKTLADITTIDEVQYALADANVDGKVNVKDVTEIQKFLADLPANALIGTVVVAEDLIPEVPATDDEPVVDEPTVDETTPDEPTADEATEDEEVVVPAIKYYIVGYINGVDYYDTGYEIVDGKITLELDQDSYVLIQDEFGTQYWTDGWLDFNPTSAVLGSYGTNDKFHVAAGTVTLTWDAETFTLALA